MNDDISELAIRKAFGNKLYTLRQAAGLTGEAMGNRVGVNGASICNWESARFCPTTQSYNMLVDAFPELKDAELEAVITIDIKPGGRPTGIPYKTPKDRKKPSAPAHPKVMNGRKPRVKDVQEEVKVPEKKQPEQLKLELEEPVKPVRHPVNKKSEVEEILVKVPLSMLREVAGKVVGIKGKRTAFIQHLRNSGVDASTILNIIHEALP